MRAGPARVPKTVRGRRTAARTSYSLFSSEPFPVSRIAGPCRQSVQRRRVVTGRGTAAYRNWRPDRESNPGARICSPLRHHSAIGPRCAAEGANASFWARGQPCRSACDPINRPGPFRMGRSACESCASMLAPGGLSSRLRGPVQTSRRLRMTTVIPLFSRQSGILAADFETVRERRAAIFDDGGSISCYGRVRGSAVDFRMRPRRPARDIFGVTRAGGASTLQNRPISAAGAQLRLGAVAGARYTSTRELVYCATKTVVRQDGL